MSWWMILGWILVAIAQAPGECSDASWTRLPSIPDREGFAGPFAGNSHGAWIVAGGANFPDARPWDGGKKVYYDRIYLLESEAKPPTEPSTNSDGPAWREVGRLPRATAYGVSVSWRDRILCAGGNDHEHALDEAFSMEWRDGNVEIVSLPRLPIPLTNACSEVLGDTWIVCGGMEGSANNAATANAWRIDLNDPTRGWEAIDPIPGPGRMLAMSAVADQSFWILGGVELRPGESSGSDTAPRERHYLKDVYRWSPNRGWSRARDLPMALAAAPSPCPIDRHRIYVVGGDDGSQLGTSPSEHRGFSNKLLCFDVHNDTWLRAGTIPAPRVTVPCVRWLDGWGIPSGEQRPGVRSPEVWKLVFP